MRATKNDEQQKRMKLKFNLQFYTAAYFFILLFLYHFKVKDYYYWRYIANYVKYTSFDFSVQRLFIASIIFYINLQYLKRIDSKKLSFAIVYMFFLLITVPSLIAFTSRNMYPFKLMLYHQLFFWLLLFFSKVKLNLSNIPSFTKKQGLVILTAIIVLGTLPYIIILGPHINLENLLLTDIYETRALMASKSNPYFAYMYSPFTKIIIPLFIVFALERKKWGLAITGILYLVLFFLFGGHKTVYLGLLLLLVFYRYSYYQIINIFLKLFILLMIITIILALFDNNILWYLIFRRVHFLPTLLDICYLDFFQDNYLYYAETLPDSISKSPYQLQHANLIGKHYFMRPKMGANNGLISDGYMNLGFIGVMINVIIISFYFMVLNNLNIKAKYFGMYFLVIFSFISSSLPTVLLTHGAFLLLVVSIFFLNEKNK